MIETVLAIYSIVAVIVFCVLTYTAYWLYKKKEFPDLVAMIVKRIPEYTIFWPWRVVGFPIYCMITHRGEESE